MIPAGSVIHSRQDVRNYRIINIKEQEYQDEVLAAANTLRREYWSLFGNSPSEKAAV